MAATPDAAPTPPSATARRTPRWRRITATILVVLASLLVALAVLAGFVRYEALDPPTVEKLAGELIANPTINNEIAAKLADALEANVDLEAALSERLPPDQQRLAAPLAGLAQELVNRSSERLLERPRVQEAFVAAVLAAHGELLRLLEDRGRAISTTGGEVSIDLRPLVIDLGDRVAIIGNVAGRLPPDAGKIVIVQSDKLRQTQRLVHLLDIGGRVLWFLYLLVAALALWLAVGRRRETLRALGIGAIVGGAIVLIARRVAGNHVLDALVPPGSTRDAAGEAWDILTALLVDGGRTLLGFGVLLVLGAWLAGPTDLARRWRGWLAPHVARWEIAYGAAAGLLLLLVWWGPTVQLHRWNLVLCFAVLLALGVWAFRRQTLQEYPQAARPPG